MKKMYLLFVASLFASCGPEVQTDTKIVSEIKVVDSQGNPIDRAYVEIWLNQPYSWNGDSVVNDSYSNTAGDTFMLFSPPNGDDGFIEIGVFGDNPIDETPTSPFEYSYVKRIRTSDCVGYRLPISQITLYRADELVNLTLEVPSDGGPNQYLIKDLTIDGALSNSYYFGAFDAYEDALLKAAKNQTITIHYTTYQYDSEQETEHTETIEIGTQDVIHTLSI